MQRCDNVRKARETDADLSKTVKTAFFPDEYPAKVASLAGGASSTSRNDLQTIKQNSMKAKYYIDGDGGNATYEKLNDVKHHVSFSPKYYEGMCVFRVNDESFYRVIKVTKSGKVILSNN